ncbi:MAG TPA: sulfotransferase domain-containing protein [Pseudomonadales bacterium]|nr:sulfotransferase domain-containing protein [Pseudomonadales bacterium]
MGRKNRTLGVLRRATGFLSEDRRRHNEHLVRGAFERRDLRRADSVLISFPKAGRTWLRVMLTHAMQRHLGLPSDELLVFDNFKRIDARVPSVLFTHLFYSTTSDAGRQATIELLRERATLLLVRQPIDVSVSWYHQWKHREKDAKNWLHGYPPSSADVDIDSWITHPSWGLDRVIDYYNRMGELVAEVPGSMTVRYETLRAEPVAGLAAILRHIGLEIPDEVIEAAVEHSRFERMQQRERDGDLPSKGGSRLAAGDPDNADSFKARRGKVGGYRDELTPATVAWAEARVTERMHARFAYGEDGDPSGA